MLFQEHLLDGCSLHDHSYCKMRVVSCAEIPLPGKFVEKVHVIRRYFSVNIFHLLHDDWLGAWYLRKRMPGQSSSTIFFYDDYPVQGTDELFRALPRVKDLVRRDSLTTLLKDALIGTSKIMMWYQYGFGNQVQGPIKDSTASRVELAKAAADIRAFFGVATYPKDQRRLAVILARRRNRRILNEDQLEECLSQNHFQVRRVSLEKNSLKELVEIFSKAHVLIGMHGSLLGLAGLLMPAEGVLIEIFPWRVPAGSFTPFRRMLELRDDGIKDNMRHLARYAFIETPSKDFTRMPPIDASFDVGGIGHLSKRHQQRLLRLEEATRWIRVHPCCYDPEWMRAAYQDTLVQCSDVISRIDSATLDTASGPS